MPKWKADAKEFTVGVNYSEVRGYQTTIPKPVAARLDNPEKVTFVIRRGKVEVRAAGPGVPHAEQGTEVHRSISRD
ncbi:MAG: hypothetical protein WAK40_00380 [Thermoplasmata archaeon]